MFLLHFSSSHNSYFSSSVSFRFHFIRLMLYVVFQSLPRFLRFSYFSFCIFLSPFGPSSSSISTPAHSLAHIFFVTSLLLNLTVFLVFLSLYFEEFPKKQILMTSYIAYCKILLKENGYKIV